MVLYLNVLSAFRLPYDIFRYIFSFLSIDERVVLSLPPSKLNTGHSRCQLQLYNRKIICIHRHGIVDDVYSWQLYNTRIILRRYGCLDTQVNKDKFALEVIEPTERFVRRETCDGLQATWTVLGIPQDE